MKWALHYNNDLCEPLYCTIEERKAYIQAHKPADEIETRLKYMRVLTDEEAATIPRAYICAWNWKNHEPGYQPAWKNYNKVQQELYAWHNTVCQAGCPWNGTTLFPEKEL